MAWLAVDKDGTEAIYSHKPARFDSQGQWARMVNTHRIELPSGSIEKLIGRRLKWENKAVEL